MPRPMKKCRVCGKEFESSKQDYTVNCPEHRGKQIKVTRSTSYSPKEVSAKGRTCTVTSGVSGKCGKPAVYAFESSSGEIFAECREHH
jgi:DNA-directed RNA polymerase subunit RPC12/RpoP